MGVEKWSDWWKTGQIGGENWSDWWKTGQIDGKLVRLVEKPGQIGGKLVRLVENWSDWWKTGQIVGKLLRLVENWTKKLTRSTGGKWSKVPRLCTKVDPRQGGNGRKVSQTSPVS